MLCKRISVASLIIVFYITGEAGPGKARISIATSSRVLYQVPDVRRRYGRRVSGKLIAKKLDRLDSWKVLVVCM